VRAFLVAARGRGISKLASVIYMRLALKHLIQIIMLGLAVRQGQLRQLHPEVRRPS